MLSKAVASLYVILELSNEVAACRGSSIARRAGGQTCERIDGWIPAFAGMTA